MIFLTTRRQDDKYFGGQVDAADWNEAERLAAEQGAVVAGEWIATVEIPEN